ncbi:VIT1/CCC1 transporter family protein [Pseudonocardia acidicola]|uniref:Rubrerythrin family protein n=1 Tax=Pseudonocardia acidicola TaxID=2724939 RepID=A0ABX1SFK8_9PSEU|nr:VIT1/CCC1 family protein [Pseudonocardia acidicola]NMH99273.1 rubrerythrin family protein [Pseudonocardia acidicola]
MADDSQGSRDDVRRFRRNYRDEVDGAALYQAMADGEESPELARVYRRLGDVERRHAEFWAQRIRAAGSPAPPPRPSVRTRLLSGLARRFGAGLLVPTVARTERLGRNMYDDQPEAAATSMPSDERSHAFLLGEIRGGVPGSSLARLEGRHRTPGGNAVRAAVLGANDGLLSNLSLVTGVAGSGVLPGTAVLVTGLAGLLAGAFSMALGEWVSVQSSRELAERQLAIEADELAALPEEEAEELRLIYQARGLPEEEAYSLAKRLLDDPDNALDVMAREELGIDPDERGGNPWTAALTSFLLFSIGAIIPVLPFFWLDTRTGVLVSAIAGGLGLFALGAAASLFTGQGMWKSGLRQMVLGLLAAAVTFGVGRALGVAIG